MPVSKPHPFNPAAATLALAIALALDPSEPMPTALAASPSPANTIAVDNCNDDGAGSLRAAVAAAVDGSVIDMTHIACSTITLTSGEIFTQGVTLAGPGAGRLSIRVPDGGSSRNVHFGFGGGVIKDMTIESGRNNWRGGCIYSQGGLTLISATVRNCRVDMQGGSRLAGGGAIFSGDFLAISNSTITDSRVTAQTGGMATVTGGGGILAHEGMTLSDSTISGNSVSIDDSASGGGIFIAAEYGNRWNQSILRSTISDNWVNYRTDGPSSSGGIAIYGNGGNLWINQSTIAGNYASGAPAINVRKKTIDMANCTIAGNLTLAWPPTSAAAVVTNDNFGVHLFSTIIAQNVDMQSGYAIDDLWAPNTTVTGDHNLIARSPVSPPGTLSANPGLLPPRRQRRRDHDDGPAAGQPRDRPRQQREQRKLGSARLAVRARRRRRSRHRRVRVQRPDLQERLRSISTVRALRRRDDARVDGIRRPSISTGEKHP